MQAETKSGKEREKKKPRDGSTRLSSVVLPESHVIYVQRKTLY
jgi:hypothetical protein